MEIICFALAPKPRGKYMNTMEVLTLLLLIFSALSYIDNHKKK